jgi:hypothetical protein
MRKTAELNVVKTTIHPNDNVIDWVPIESQGKIASPPPLPATPFNSLSTEKGKEADRKTSRPLALLELEGAEKGPGGTVPIPRQNLKILSPNQTLSQRLSKPPFLNVSGVQDTASAAQFPHWYCSTAQHVPNTGTQGTLSMFNAFVENGHDFSLLQTAVIKSNVPTPGNPGKLCGQTLEAGWINYPSQVSQPHLFTFFTTNGYTQNGDYIGGWNTDSKGWVQVDTTIFPGTPFSVTSQDGGAQYDLAIQYSLFQNNWWLWVIDRWIGYYPASLYSNNEADPNQTLAMGSDQINWYGEIYQNDPTLTTTDMGSGEWPETGFGHSAYIHNITYIDTNGNAQGYDGSAQASTSDPSRYRMITGFNSGQAWGSYIWLGGPGFGGQVGSEVKSNGQKMVGSEVQSNGQKKLQG